MGTVAKELFFTKAIVGSDTYFKAVANPTAMTVQAILTYPMDDLEGDYLHPNACDFADVPYVNVEHNPKAKVAKGEVRWGDIQVEGKVHCLPLGTSHFDEKNAESRQAFRLCEHGVYPGVSLEFENRPGGRKDRGFKSILRGGPAYEFTDVFVPGWAHCARPVNPGALVLLPEHEKALKILTDKRIGSETLLPAFHKSLERALAHAPRKTTVLGNWSKSMDDMGKPPVDDSGMDDASSSPTADIGGGMTPTPAAGMSAVQGVKDLCAQIKELLKGGEHVEGKKSIMEFCEGIEAMADELATKMKEHFPDDGLEAPPKDDGTEADADAPLPMTDDGAIKTKSLPGGGFPRFRLDQIKWVEEPKREKGLPKAVVARFNTRINKLYRDLGIK